MRWILLTALTLLCAPAAVQAQQAVEVVGQRALGMAGAFVAVADDASAVFWNPAGLATGQPYGATIEWNRSQFGDLGGPPLPGSERRSATLTSLGTWPLGLSFLRLQGAALVAGPTGDVRAEVLETRQFGVTILQTVVPGLVVGSTLKFLRGSALSLPADGSTAGAALDRASEAERRSTGAFDLDLGLMADLEYARVGVTVRNLREPEFSTSADSATRLTRQARLGLAVLPSDGVTLAMDVDLNTVGLRDGLRRMIAFGGESRLGSRLSVRAGVRWDLEGPRMPVASVGASVAVRSGLWLDGHYAQGRRDGARSYGVALRAGY